MRMALVPLVLVLVVPKVTRAAEADREALTRLSHEWMAAVARKDRGALEALLAPDYELRGVGTGEPGVPRAQWLENATRMQWYDEGYSHLQVDVQGDVGIVASRYAFRVDPGEWRPTIGTTSTVVDVWVRNDGRWQVQRRLLGGDGITRWMDRTAGFAAALALAGTLLLGRRLLRRRRAREAP